MSAVTIEPGSIWSLIEREELLPFQRELRYVVVRVGQGRVWFDTAPHVPFDIDQLWKETPAFNYPRGEFLHYLEPSELPDDYMDGKWDEKGRWKLNDDEEGAK